MRLSQNAQGLTWRGAFTERSSSYVPDDIVSDGATSHICTSAPSKSIWLAERVDSFARDDASDGWGTASDGVTVWTNYDADPVTPWSIVSNRGRITTADNSNHEVQFGGALSSADMEMVVRFTTHVLANTPRFNLRSIESSGHTATLKIVNALGLGDVVLTLNNPSGGFEQAGPFTIPSFDPTVAYWVRFRALGQTYQARFWLDGDPEPDTWDFTHTTSINLSDVTTCGLAASQNGDGATYIDFDSLVVNTTAFPAPSVDTGHWAPLATGTAGVPVLHGPYVVDYTDIPHDGDKKTLWTPAVGDVLLRLSSDFQTVTPWSAGAALYIGQDVHGDTNPITNILVYSSDPTALDSVGGGVGGFTAGPDGTAFYNTMFVFGSADPVQIQLVMGGQPDPTRGHVELYALIARPVAP